MRIFRLSLVSLLGGLPLGCPDDVATPADGDTTGTGSGTGSVSQSETGADSSHTGTGAPTTVGPGESTDISGSTTKPDPGDTGPNGSTSAGASASSSSTGASSSSSSTGDVTICGDGQQDPGEACDDGNDVEDDGCLATCEFGGGAVIEEKPLPPLAVLEKLRCFTAIDQQQLPGDGDALVFGSDVSQAGPEQQAAARMQQLRLPGLAPPEWTYFEWAGIYGRRASRMATAANGDIIVAGIVHTEAVDVDTGGHLWLARFTPAGEVVWSEDYQEHGITPVDLELAPDGDIVLVGSASGLGDYTAALRFHDDGKLVWEHADPWQEGVNYSGLTLDDDGNIYLLASHIVYDTQETALMLQALSGAGALLWTKLYAPLDGVSVRGGDLVWTLDDRLIAGVNRSKDQFALAAFDTGGAALWWKLWGTEAGSALAVGRLLANDDGSVHALVQQISAGDNKVIAALATRFDATGALVWSHLTPGAAANDALHGPDGLLYVLSHASILVHLP